MLNHPLISLNAASNSLFSVFVPIVILRQLSHSVILCLFLTMMPRLTRVSYIDWAFKVLTSRKLASLGYTFSHSGNMRMAADIRCRSWIRYFTCLSVCSWSRSADIACSCVCKTINSAKSWWNGCFDCD